MPPQTVSYQILRRGVSMVVRCGLMRFALLSPAGLIDAERFTMHPTHRTNFKKGP